MVLHTDDVTPEARAFGHIRATRRRLGAAAGAHATGLSRWRIEAGAVGAPAHTHADEEELFFVLEGSGHVWQDGRAFPVAAGDTILFPAGGRAHTLFGGPIDVLAFGSGSSTGLTWLPRANVMWAGSRWLPLDGPNPLEAEAALGPLAPGEVVDPADERPPWIVGITDVEGMTHTHGDSDHTTTDLGAAAGSRLCGLVHDVIAPGATGNPPHCHSGEEELFVVLDGTGLLELHEGDAIVTFPLRAGTVVARPAGTGVAHAFRAGDDAPLTLLAFGQRDTRDAVFYPATSSVRLPGLGGLRFAVQPLSDAG